MNKVNIFSRKSFLKAGVIVSDTAIALADPGRVIYENGRKLSRLFESLNDKNKEEINLGEVLGE